MGPPAKRHLNPVFWRGDDGHTLNVGLVQCSFMIFQGILTSIAKKPNIFCDFSGGRCPDPCPPLDPPMTLVSVYIYADLHGLSLLRNGTSTEILCAGSFFDQITYRDQAKQLP